jgi:hypothetical protein
MRLMFVATSRLVTLDEDLLGGGHAIDDRAARDVSSLGPNPNVG